MVENSKYLKTDQAVKVRKGLTQACAEKEISSVPHICYGIKPLTILQLLLFISKLEQTKSSFRDKVEALLWGWYFNLILQVEI